MRELDAARSESRSDRSGPRTLRVLWGAVRGELDERYGDVTIGMLLDAYQRPQPTEPPQAPR